MAPRKQLASNSTSALRSFFLGQQTSRASAPAKRKIFVNCENSFSQFSFRRSRTSEVFQPTAIAARRPALSLDGESVSDAELLLRMDFLSAYDSNAELLAASRPALDAAFVIDVSGSMQSPFMDDPDKRSKLAMAVNCLECILEKLTPQDRVAIIFFDTLFEIACPLTFATKREVEKMLRIAKKKTPGGGTDLAKGLRAGFDVLRQAAAADDSGERRMKRVFFLTDMESSFEDENKVIVQSLTASKGTKGPPTVAAELSSTSILGKRKATQTQPPQPTSAEKAPKAASAFHSRASPPIHVSIIGIGVDLSVETVERISAIPGARYMSVVSGAEMVSTVAADFDYDATPIALNIEVAMPAGITIEKVMGSAELNSLRPGASKAVISAEFAVPLEADDSCKGGIYLFKLTEADRSLAGTMQAIMVQWDDMSGTRRSCEVPFMIPAALTGTAASLSPPSCDPGIRVARALAEYVHTLTEYVVASEEGEAAAAAGAAGAAEGVQRDLLDILRRCFRGDLKFTSLSQLPEGTPPLLKAHCAHYLRFTRLSSYLRSELENCGDTSLSGGNRNIADTLQQIISLEVEEISRYISAAEMDSVGGIESCPRGMACPIGLVLMTDPVIAADGHSYERGAISQWFDQGHDTSPVTGARLSSMALVSNHALKAAIQDYRESQAELMSSSSSSRGAVVS
jgi:hypothetical protein